jgi:FkbM family methyltransferase
MSLRRRVSSITLFRAFALRLLRALARDISIRNPWTGDPLWLNSFLHKGYWFFGREREAGTMRRLASVVQPGDTVFEVGGHIGYVCQYFSRLVGSDGRVVVFEPGTNNLPYLQRNVQRLSNVRIEAVAVSDHSGEAILYQDNITGQNNSLLPDYLFLTGVESSHHMRADRQEVKVRLTTLDAFLESTGMQSDFIKIDIEGHELAALGGASQILRKARGLMVEVTENQAEVGRLLLAAGFELSDDSGTGLASLEGYSGNVFALRK